MNSREKFQAIMAFEKDVPCLKWEYGYWAGVVRQWYAAGLPEVDGIPAGLGTGEPVRAEIMGKKPGGIVDKDIRRYFQLEPGFQRIPLNNYMSPTFPEVLLEDHGDWILKRNNWGITVRDRKDQATPTSFLTAPVQCREDWEKIKAEKLQPTLDGRLPANWETLKKEYQSRDYPLIIGGGQGFYGTPRYLLGDERILTQFYDDSELILDINEHLCNFWISLYDQVLQQTTADMALIWEDMCYKNGPLISPRMFDRFMLPFYKRLTGLFRDHNVKVIFVDTDGDFWKLIPKFIEGGVTGVFPCEVNAKMDVLEVRKSFPRFQMMGGVDKMKLFDGQAAIDQELENKIFPAIQSGGFIPSIDHLVPEAAPWSSFKYYRTRLNQFIDGC